jgi:phosphate transport system substrate-binding protein
VRQANTDVRAFLDFATSDAAGDALKEAGFIDETLTTTRFRSFRDRVINSIGGNSEDFSLDLMKELLTNFEKGVRLSATMRFESGSSELDSESVQLLPKVADYLKALPFDEVKVLVVGFSDKSGWFDANRALSNQRAQAVRDAILLKSDGTIDPVNIEMQGYGELFPAACNDTETGRNENRRVEIWLIPKANASPSILTKQF